MFVLNATLYYKIDPTLLCRTLITFNMKLPHKITRVAEYASIDRKDHRLKNQLISLSRQSS